MEHVDALSRGISQVLAAFEDELRKKINSEGTMEIDLESEDSRLIWRKGDEEWSLTKDGKLWNKPKNKNIQRLVVESLSERKEILETIHGNGHFSHKKCYHTLQRKYFWPGMSTDCQVFTNSCMTCQMRRAPLKRQGSKLGKIVATRRNELIGIDLFGGIPKTKEGYKYVLVITDFVTKYTVLVPVKSKRPLEIALALFKEWILVYGPPEKIQSDRGKEFTSRVSEELYKVFDIHKYRTSGYHPQANGQTERFNKTMADMLAKRCGDDQRNWSKFLKVIQLEYNCMVHRVTGETPFYLMMAREPVLPIDLAKRIKVPESLDWLNSELPELTSRLSIALKRIKGDHQKNAKLYNRRKKPVGFKIGDLVLLWTMVRTKKDKGIHKKISFPMTGPYKVVEKGPDGHTVKIVCPELDNGKQWVVNVNKLRKFVERPAWMGEQGPTCDEAGPTMSPEEMASEKSATVENMEVENSGVEVGHEKPENMEISEKEDSPPAKEITPADYKGNNLKGSKGQLSPHCIGQDDLVQGLKVDALIGKSWKCGEITKLRKQGGLQVWVIGKYINAWISMYKIQKCLCDVQETKMTTEQEIRKVNLKKYWKI